MSLINCPECNHEISEFAATCSSCGLQVASAKEARPVGSAITTVQETSKRLRLHTLGAIAAILFGIVFLAYTRVKNRKLLFISIGFGVFFIHALIYLPELFLETSLNLGENGHLLIHLIALIFILFGTFKD